MQTDNPEDVQERYRDNFARHLLGITLYVQSEIMHNLTEEHGHTGLRLQFEPYISIIGAHGARLSDIADLLGISRQAANQTANQIEAAGYVRREAEPRDGRAKLLVTCRHSNANTPTSVTIWASRPLIQVKPISSRHGDRAFLAAVAARRRRSLRSSASVTTRT